MMKQYRAQAFTLIELSIVLVIIGLIVGGILVGQDLIRAAQVRAQITQIEKYNQAVNTFRGKYGYLPGDIVPSAVSQFGFTASPTRAGTMGRGDGNGELDGISGTTPYAWNQNGENAFFWEDLSTNSHLIEGSFNTAYDGSSDACSSTQCSLYFPSAKIGNGNYVYTYSGYASQVGGGATIGVGPNFFGLSIIYNINGGSNVGLGTPAPGPGLSVMQAYKIDQKIDDGLPTTGNVLAQYLNNNNGTGTPGWSTNSNSDTTTTCYNSSTNLYSISISNGAYVNCGLSFKFQ